MIIQSYYARSGLRAQLPTCIFTMALISMNSVVRIFVSVAVMLRLTRCSIPLCFQYQRITLNKITLAFFLFGVVQCFIQMILQSLLYSVDLDNSTLVMSIIREAKVPRREIAWLTGNSMEFKLRLCTDIPFGMTDSFCTIAFDSSRGSVSVPVPAGFRRSVCCSAASSCRSHCLFGIAG